MKRRIRLAAIIMTLMLVMQLLPIKVNAATDEDFWRSMSTTYYYDQLSSAEKKLYDRMDAVYMGMLLSDTNGNITFAKQQRGHSQGREDSPRRGAGRDSHRDGLWTCGERARRRSRRQNLHRQGQTAGQSPDRTHFAHRTMGRACERDTSRSKGSRGGLLAGTADNHSSQKRYHSR